MTDSLANIALILVIIILAVPALFIGLFALAFLSCLLANIGEAIYKLFKGES